MSVTPEVIADEPAQATPSANAGPRSKYRGDLQGLRAVAVVLVALGHAGVGFLAGGYIGVDVFFVLSGYLITGLLLSDVSQTQSVRLVDFYVRRARRILPAAALTLIATCIAAYLLLNFVRARQTVVDSIPAALFWANIHFANIATNYFASTQPPSPVQHFWSLAVEEQFYLVWPVLAAAVVLSLRGFGRFAQPAITARRRLRAFGPLLLLLVIASLAWSVHDTHTNRAAAYFSTFARAWELGLGAALAVGMPWLRRIRPRASGAMGWIGLLAILAAATTFSASTPFPGYAALLPTMGAALVIAAGIPDRKASFAVGRPLATKPMGYVGDRSYAFYLWHWPVLTIAMEHEGHRLSTGVNLLLLAGAFLLSLVSYKFIENPLRRRKWSPPARGLVLWPASLLSFFAVAAVLALAINIKEANSPGGSNFATRPAALLTDSGPVLPAVAAAVRAAEAKAPIPSALTPAIGGLLASEYSYPGACGSPSGSTASEICQLGATASHKLLVVMGDSHAQMWMPAILGVAQVQHWKVVPLTKSSCTPFDWVHESPGSECRTWYRWAVRQISRMRPTATVLTGDYNNTLGIDPTTVSTLTALAKRVKSASRQVVILGDPPSQLAQPVDCLLTSGANLGTCTTRLRPYQLSLTQSLESDAALSGVEYIDSTRWFCSNSVCPLVIGATITHSDDNHITAIYASELAKPLGSALRRVTGLQ